MTRIGKFLWVPVREPNDPWRSIFALPYFAYLHCLCHTLPAYIFIAILCLLSLSLPYLPSYIFFAQMNFCSYCSDEFLQLLPRWIFAVTAPPSLQNSSNLVVAGFYIFFAIPAQINLNLIPNSFSLINRYGSLWAREWPNVSFMFYVILCFFYHEYEKKNCQPLCIFVLFNTLV